MRFTRNGVPQQKAYSSSHDQHGERAHASGLVAVFVVQVVGSREPGEENKHFVEVAHRDVANIGAHEVAFVPAHKRTHQSQRHSGPGELGANTLKAIGVLLRRKNTQPVKACAHEEQHTHPQNGGLAGQQVFEQEHRVGTRLDTHTIGLIQPHSQQAQHGHRDRELTQRRPEPGQCNERGHNANQNRNFVAVHEFVEQHIGIDTACRAQSGKNPIPRRTAGKVPRAQSLRSVRLIQVNGLCRSVHDDLSEGWFSRRC